MKKLTGKLYQTDHALKQYATDLREKKAKKGSANVWTYELVNMRTKFLAKVK